MKLKIAIYYSMGFPNYILSAPDVRIIAMEEELLIETKKVMKAAYYLNKFLMVCFVVSETL